MIFYKKYNVIYFLILLLFFYLLYTYFIYPLFIFKTSIESFKNIDDIDFYVITMGEKDRLKNIEKQVNSMKKNNENIVMNIVDAVIGKNLDIDKLVSEKTLIPDIYENIHGKFNKEFENRKNEVGCFMSHLKIYNMIKDKISNNTNKKYSVIFEDDFDLPDDFVNKLDNLHKKTENYIPDFDYLFLGISCGANGKHIVDDIFYIPGGCFGTYGYIINNNSIDKILNSLQYIYTTVDVEIFDKCINNELTGFYVNPSIVYPGGFETTIRKNI